MASLPIPPEMMPPQDMAVVEYIDPAIREERILDAARSIVGRLSILARDQVRAKTLIEQRWIRNLRNYYGRYDDISLRDLKQDRRSNAFVKLTRHKTNGWSARLSDLLFPTDDRNWGIQPTPVPMLVKAAKDAQESAKQGVDAANAAPDPQQAAMIAQQADAFAQAAKQSTDQMAEAERRSERMQSAIEDQFVQSNYGSRCRDIIEDGCRIGTGVLKGPLTSNRLRREWRPGEGGYELAQLPDPQPEFLRVDPWHFFPDMSARTIEEAEFTFERALPTKQDLRRYAMRLGFNKNAVRRLLKDGPKTMGTEGDYISELREISGEGQPINNRYVMWEYHGTLETEDVAMLMRASGGPQAEDMARQYEDDGDPLQENRVIIYFCEDEVLKIETDYPLDSGDTLYSVWNFERGETSIFGIGVPEIMNDSQGAVNGAWRMMLDNGRLSTAPQIVMAKGNVEPQDGNWNLSPNKVWLLTSTALTSNRPPFEVFNIPNNQQQLAGIIALARDFSDEETSMPNIAQGEAGAQAQTLGGMSMLFNSANVVFRRVVKSFDDDLTKPTIRRAYDWNMQFNPDDTIKGDMQVDARGTSVLLVREIQSQNLMSIMTNWTVHPKIGPMINVREGIKKTLQTLMIPPDDVLLSEEDAQKAAQEEQQAAQAAAQQQAAPAKPDDSAVRLQIAQIDAQSREAVANMNLQATQMELAAKYNMTLQQLQAQLHEAQINSQTRLAETDMKHQSQERIFSAKTAIEDAREARAEAYGKAPDGWGHGIG